MCCRPASLRRRADRQEAQEVLDRAASLATATHPDDRARVHHLRPAARHAARRRGMVRRDATIAELISRTLSQRSDESAIAPSGGGRRAVRAFRPTPRSCRGSGRAEQTRSSVMPRSGGTVILVVALSTFVLTMPARRVSLRSATWRSRDRKCTAMRPPTAAGVDVPRVPRPSRWPPRALAPRGLRRNPSRSGVLAGAIFIVGVIDDVREMSPRQDRGQGSLRASVLLGVTMYQFNPLAG